MKTEALWYLGERSIELREIEIPEPGAHEVLVEMEICGMCSWDILAFAGKFGRFHPYPFCAGHEGVGRIVKVGERVSNLEVGQRVACHELPIGTPGGALMARHALRTEQKVSVIPENSISLKYWVVEPVACIVNGLVYSGIQPGDSVALIGAGYMGLIFMQGLAKTLAADVTCFDVDEKRLALAQSFGASRTVKVENGKIPEQLRRNFDVVIETAGNAGSMELALAVAKPAAIIENFAWHHHRYEFELDEWHVNAWRILNIQPGANPHFGDIFPRTIRLMMNGTFSNEKLITHTAPIELAYEIFMTAVERKDGYMKGVITFK
jgi:2-desacetyl-2-hydroxyethyl bacteriochlorophyllide A dehydrogenase